MTESVTQNYKWTKPEVTKSAATWGGFLNTDLDSIDSLVFANQQGVVPIGSITMFGGATAPANWLICDGSSLDTTAYAALFAVLQYAHGGGGTNFNLPNLQQKFPLGASSSNALGSGGGSLSVPIAVGNLPAHAHPITDVAHSHTAQQNAHSHYVYQDAHSHGANQDAHSHGGVVVPGGTFSLGQAGWTTSTGRTDTQQPAVHIDTQQPGVHADTQQPAIGVNASGTGLSTTQNVGSGTPLSVTPPFVALNFIIRFS